MYKIGESVYYIKDEQVLQGTIQGVNTIFLCVDGQEQKTIKYNIIGNYSNELIRNYYLFSGNNWYSEDQVFSNEEEPNKIVKEIKEKREALIEAEKKEKEEKAQRDAENVLQNLKRKYGNWHSIEKLESIIVNALKDGVIKDTNTIVI